MFIAVLQVLHNSTLYRRENSTVFDLDIVTSFDNILLLGTFPWKAQILDDVLVQGIDWRKDKAKRHFLHTFGL